MDWKFKNACACRHSAAAKGPWLLEEILRWGTAHLFDPAARAAAASQHADKIAKADAADRDHVRSHTAASGKSSGKLPDSASPDEPEAAAPANEAAAYSDDALNALIRWSTSTAQPAAGGHYTRSMTPQDPCV